MKEFERRLRVQDSVIKFLTVRIDETLKRLDKRKKEREKRAHRRPQPAAPQPSLAQQMLGGGAEGAPSVAWRTGARRTRRPAHPCLPPRTPRPARPCRTRPSPQPRNKGDLNMAEPTEVEDRSRQSQRPTGGDKAAAVGKKQYFRRKKVCRFCVEKIDDINYKDVAHAAGLHRRARQDRSAPHFRRLRAAPAPSDRRHPEGAQHRPAAFRGGGVRGESNRWKSFFGKTSKISARAARW